MGNTTQKLTSFIWHICNQEEEEEEDDLEQEGNGSSGSSFFTCGIFMDQEGNGGSSSSFFTCGICTETMSMEKKFNKKKCSHPFCSDCISQHIYYKVHYNNMDQVKCPHLGCTKLLDPLSCRSILAVDTFVRWCDVICERMAIGSSNAYCYCPYMDCSALVLDQCSASGRSNCGAAAVTKAECPSCKRVFCFQCKVPWHAGYRCGEGGMTRRRDEELFDQLAEKKRWKRCPKCNACVEVSSGCAVVTCRCKNMFCYKCGAKHTKMHQFTCPFVWIQDFK